MRQKLWLSVLSGVLLCSCGSPADDAVPQSATFALAGKQSLTIASNRNLQIGAADLTISAWINLASKNANEVAAAKDNDATKEGSEYWLGYEKSSDRLNFQVEDPVSGTMFVKANSFGSPPTGQWLHVTGWFDHTNQTVNIQVNGGPTDEATAGTITRMTETPFSIGSDANVGSFFDGQIRNVGFFKRLLSEQERSSLYNPSVAPQGFTYNQLSQSLQSESTATFVSWWDLTGTDGNQYDSRSTANNLTFYDNARSAAGNSSP